MKLFRGTQKLYDLTFMSSFIALRKKTKKLSKPTHLFDTCLDPCPAPLPSIELLPSLVPDRSDNQCLEPALGACLRSETFSLKFFFANSPHRDSELHLPFFSEDKDHGFHRTILSLGVLLYELYDHHSCKHLWTLY